MALLGSRLAAASPGLCCARLPCSPGRLCDPGQHGAICVHPQQHLTAPGSGRMAAVGTAVRPIQVFWLELAIGPGYFQPNASVPLQVLGPLTAALG